MGVLGYFSYIGMDYIIGVNVVNNKCGGKE